MTAISAARWIGKVAVLTVTPAVEPEPGRRRFQAEVTMVRLGRVHLRNAAGTWSLALDSVADMGPCGDSPVRRARPRTHAPRLGPQPTRGRGYPPR